MRKLFLTPVFLSLAVFTYSHAGEEKLFGEDFEVTSAITMDEALAKAQDYVGKPVVVQGEIEKVCQSKGCWFEAKVTQHEPVRVTFKDYAFFLPKDSAGKSMTMKGLLTEKTLSVKAQRHYLKDAKASKAEIKAVKEPKKVLEFVASGVKIAEK